MPRHRPAIIASLAICFVILVRIGFSDAGRVTHGFVSYYGATRLWLRGEFTAWAYDDDAYGAYLRQLTGSQVRDIYAPNTPAAALLLLPIGGLSHAAARTVWLAVSVLAVVFSMGWLAMSRPTGYSWLWTAVCLLSPPVLANLRTAQAYLVLFALETVVIAGLVRQREGMAGALLGLAFVIKPVTGGVLLVLATQQRWRAALAALAAAAVVIVTSLLFTSLEVWAEWLRVALAFARRPETSVTAYQTTAGLVRHLCVASPQWNPQPLLTCGPLATGLPLLVTAGIAVVTAVLARGVAIRTWLPAATSFSLLALPIAEDHQFVVLAIPVFLLSETWRRHRWWWFAVAVLMLVPGEWTWGRFTAGWWSLLAYPRLYATWMVWGIAVASLLRARRHGALTDAAPLMTRAPHGHRG